MDILSILTNGLNTLKNLFAWLLKKFGYKISEIDNYKEETLEVDANYLERSPECTELKKHEFELVWFKEYKYGCEKYFEIKGNVRTYFKLRGGELLWKRKSK